LLSPFGRSSPGPSRKFRIIFSNRIRSYDFCIKHIYVAIKSGATGLCSANPKKYNGLVLII
jgi:hypothetical protein